MLFDDPDKALVEYDLSDEEVASLKSNKFDANIGELEERISRAGLRLVADGGADVRIEDFLFQTFINEDGFP